MAAEQGRVTTRGITQAQASQGSILRLFRNAQRLFHVAVGLSFLGLAAGSGWFCYHEYQFYLLNPADYFLKYFIVAAISFTVLLVVCGLYSFVKARSVR